MRIRCNKILGLRLCLVLLGITFGRLLHAERPVGGSYEVFPTDLRQMVTPVIADFVERYLYERINLDSDISETRRRMKFDEVECTFPVQESVLEKLRSADGLSVNVNRGKTYAISWYAGEELVGEMKFPVSYNMIAFTNQVESYKNLLQRLRKGASSGRKEMDYMVSLPKDESDFFKRVGETFYLGHLDSGVYLDAQTGKPVWSQDYPSESVANLFVYERPVADVLAEVSLEAYNGDTERIEIPVNSLREVMDENGCKPYFGISKIDEHTGEIEALVVCHHPDLAYLHKMEVRILPENLWKSGERPRLSIRFVPYIKLHNLTNLWGEKN